MCSSLGQVLVPEPKQLQACLKILLLLQITIKESTMAHNGAAAPEASPSLLPVFKCKVNPLYDLEETSANILCDLEETCGNPLSDLEEACANALFDLEETCSNPLFEDYTDSPNADDNQAQGFAGASSSCI